MTAQVSALDRIGGEEVAHRLAQAFYARVLADPVLLPLFRDPSEPNAERMGWWSCSGATRCTAPGAGAS